MLNWLITLKDNWDNTTYFTITARNMADAVKLTNKLAEKLDMPYAKIELLDE